MDQEAANVKHVAELLAASLDNDSARRSPADAALDSLVEYPVFYSSLVQIIAAKDEPKEVRLSAALAIKNSVERFWRRATVKALNPETKAIIRNHLVSTSSLDESDNAIARTIAVSIGKIARVDYNDSWPELFESLISIIQQVLVTENWDSSNHEVIVRRGFLYLHSAIKAISSNKLPRGRLCMQNLSQNLSPTLFAFYQENLSKLFSIYQNQNIVSTSRLESSLLIFKSLAYMATYGFPKTEFQPIQPFLEASVRDFAIFADFRRSVISSQHISDSTATILRRHLLAYPKLPKRILESDPEFFTNIGWAKHLVDTYWTVIEAAGQDVDNLVSDDDTVAQIPEQLLIRSMILCRQLTVGMTKAVVEFDSPEIAKHTANVLLTKFMPIRQAEFEQWSEDPEEWFNEQDIDNDDHLNVRKCAQKFWRDTIAVYSEPVGSDLLNLGHEFENIQIDSIDKLLSKEAIYTAYGIGSAYLIDYMDLVPWLQSKLIPQLMNQDPNMRLLVRRIVWLLGQFCNDEASIDTKISIYNALVPMLRNTPVSDISIRLTAADSIANCDTWGFSAEDFLASSTELVDNLCSMIQEVAMIESQMIINKALDAIVANIGPQIMPQIPKILNVLATLWTKASDHPQFKISVIASATQLVESLRESSQDIQGDLANLIEKAVNPAYDHSLYTQEEGLILWQNCLQFATSLTGPMIDIMPISTQIFESGTDNTQEVTKVIEAYILLDANQFATVCGPVFFSSLTNLLGEVRSEVITILLTPLKLLIQLVDAQIWVPMFINSDLFIKLFYNIDTEANKNSALVVTKYLLVLAKMMIKSIDDFMNLVNTISMQKNISQDSIFRIFVEQCIATFDNIPREGDRKIIALALACLVSRQVQSTFENFASVVTVWTSALAQTEEDDEGDAQIYKLEDAASDGGYEDLSNPQGRTKAAITKQDAGRSVRLSDTILSLMETCQQACGGKENFANTWLSRVDPYEIEELEKRLTGKLKG